MVRVDSKTLLKNLTVRDLRSFAMNYNDLVKIKNVHKLRKTELVNEIHKASKQNPQLKEGMKLYLKDMVANPKKYK